MALLDERVVAGFDVPPAARQDALEFGRRFEAESTAEPEEVQCGSSEGDAIRVVLTTSQRRLVLYFFGDGRFIYGRQLADTGERLQAGEIPLGDTHRQQRIDLFHWLADGVEESAP